MDTISTGAGILLKVSRSKTDTRKGVENERNPSESSDD